jgi:antibiotic biosynthesis monooxygenase (ABM) superfamily enzyme
MTTATMIVRLQYSDWDKFKSFLDDANAHRKKFSGTGHTLVRDLSDTQRVTVVVRFDDLKQGEAWVKDTSDPDVLERISQQAALSEVPEIWLGEDIEDVSY